MVVDPGSDETGVLTLTWEGAENADFYILLAVDSEHGGLRQRASMTGRGSTMARLVLRNVTGLNSGTQYLGIVIEVQEIGRRHRE